MSKQFLHNFFEEKNTPYQLFEILDTDGLTHFIDTDFVIQAIFKAPINEQQVISQTIRKLDFYNQPITDYLKFLAEVLIKKFNNPVMI
ncbi:MAG: hypothetical protein Q8M29_08750 [Bacteroidota bacterium]|nr:hypothetical protein [Bacteroidota bacterium]